MWARKQACRSLPSSGCPPRAEETQISGVLTCSHLPSLLASLPSPALPPASSPSQVKSWMATSWMGISLRKKGFWHRGFPLTIRLFLSHLPSQARWQLQLKGLESRFLGGEKAPSECSASLLVPGGLVLGPRSASLEPGSPGRSASSAGESGKKKKVWKRKADSSKPQGWSLQGSHARPLRTDRTPSPVMPSLV